MKQLFIAISLLSVVQFSIAQENADEILGTWFNEERGGNLQIYKSQNKYFGKMVWMIQPNDNNGKPLLDTNNPDPSKRSQPLVGLVFLSDFTYDTHDNNWRGELYDRRSGHTYHSSLKLNTNGTLSLRGYIGKAWRGRGATTILNRVSKD